jgi:hypothetical protein
MNLEFDKANFEHYEKNKIPQTKKKKKTLQFAKKNLT